MAPTRRGPPTTISAATGRNPNMGLPSSHRCSLLEFLLCFDLSGTPADHIIGTRMPCGEGPFCAPGRVMRTEG